MAWRVVVIEKPAHLSTKDNKLVIRQEDDVLLPIEDIDSLVLDNYAITISANLLAQLASFGVNTVVCDSKHLPSAILGSYSQASRGTKTALAQINLPEPTRKQLWRKNIMQKIKNQADILEKHNHPHEDLVRLAATVRSGDVGNNESIAARLYFDRLLGDSTRRKPTWHNSALNYGYAMVRSTIARDVATRGLVASIGIHHHSELNQYNLADDLIEAFRPFVDDYIISKVYLRHIGEPDDSRLTVEDRHLLVDILNSYGILIDKRYTIRHLVNKVVESFTKAILEDDPGLLVLPTIIK
jgi:CRISPR-associated protein Cas1